MHITSLLATESPLAHLHAITLLGLLDTDASLVQLQQLHALSPDSWVRKNIETALNRWQRNAWAKYWFQRFMTVSDTVQAWAAFRLFLRCVDRRFWQWQAAMSERYPFGDTRQRFFDMNHDVIKNKMKENEKKLNEQFLGQKIADKRLWPWLNGAL